MKKLLCFILSFLSFSAYADEWEKAIQADYEIYFLANEYRQKLYIFCHLNGEDHYYRFYIEENKLENNVRFEIKGLFIHPPEVIKPELINAKKKKWSDFILALTSAEKFDVFLQDKIVARFKGITNASLLENIQVSCSTDKKVLKRN